jgi:hypothetical protein
VVGDTVHLVVEAPLPLSDQEAVAAQAVESLVRLFQSAAFNRSSFSSSLVALQGLRELRMILMERTAAVEFLLSLRPIAALSS